MTMHLVLARGAQVVGDPQLEATEALSVEWLTLADLATAWRQGAITPPRIRPRSRAGWRRWGR